MKKQSEEKIIRYKKGIAKLFLTKHREGDCICSIVYYEKLGEWAKKQEIILDFKFKSFFAETKEAAEKEAQKWFGKNIATEYTIENRDGMGHFF